MDRKKFYILFACFGLFLGLNAHPVDQNDAKDIATKFMGTSDLQIVTTYKTVNNDNAFYVFNTDNGFVIVSADDCETPIIAYSHESQFDPNNIPIQMEEYLQDFVTRIQYGIDHHIVANEITAKQWEWVKSTGRLNENKTASSVAPLITAHWHQGCLYNSLCPAIESQPCGHAEVGCVAVAMALVMHYWKFPEVGFGYHSYSSNFGNLSADFANTTYQWELMPDILSDESSEDQINAVATLMYHCGISVDMYYSNIGSGAASSDIPDALVHYFKYSRAINREKKYDDNALWIAKLKQSLDSLQPIIYIGNGSGGHAFVCDGYDANDLLHFNWGWGGNGDGYYALGHLNPLGHEYNSGNYAIFNIVPNYNPFQIFVNSNPPTAGTVTGPGDYQMGDTCILTAIPSDNCEFLYWKKEGNIVSDDLTYTIIVDQDVEMEAFFSYKPAQEITANYAPDASDPSCPSVSLSWENPDDGQWVLLKEFQVQGEVAGIATDGEHIYLTHPNWKKTAPTFEKYTMDGDLVESFEIEGVPSAVSLVYDGADFYFNCIYTTNPLSELYRLDLENKTIVDTIVMDNWFGSATYDPENDGFWLGRDYLVILYDRQGNRIKNSPKVKDYINGAGYHVSQDGNPHLLLYRESGIYNYDLTNNIIFTRPLLTLQPELTSFGACDGKYDGKDALYIAYNQSIQIYEIKSTFAQNAQIMSYRIYRSDSEGNTVMIADEVIGSTFVDTTWNDALAGTYRFGISSVFANGTESEIVWSNTIVKGNHGIEENLDSEESSVQKIFENGHIVIIKDGRKYNITGQEIK